VVSRLDFLGLVPTLVRVLREYTPEITIIEFPKDDSVSVPLPIEQVRNALDAAMNAD
jgi:hypothetical protein